MNRRNLLAALAAGLAAPPLHSQDPPPGRRWTLGTGRLFLAEDARPGGDGMPLLVHLHGDHALLERTLVRSGQPGGVVSIVLPGLSSAYAGRFRDAAVFPALLEEARRALAEAVGEVRLGRVTVSSFSAGFGGVRELLKQEASAARISRLVLADTIYAGYVGDGEARRVNPDHMAPFEQYAREAAAGRKEMLITYCRLRPDGYAGTWETAAWLVAALGGEERPEVREWEGGLRQRTAFRRGKLAVLGFEGEDGEAHMLHLRNLWQFLDPTRQAPPPGM